MSQIVDKPEQRLSETSSTYIPQNGMVADTEDTQYPNRWLSIRAYIWEPTAEFFGTMILVLFGCGGNCQAVLSSSTAVSASPKGDALSSSLGWAIGIGLGVWVSEGVSEGHINPAVTLAFATFRDFPWKKVPRYLLAQLLGGICGAGIIYANYYHAINSYEGGAGIRTITGTAGLFGTYAADYMSSVSCFFSEFLGAAMLIIGIFATKDSRNVGPRNAGPRNAGPKNAGPPPGLPPLTIFLTLLGIAVSLGMETGFAVNPARDLGPRILTAMVGYGRGVFTYRNQYWLWCPILGDILGMQMGALVYDMLIYTGSKSLLNRPRAVHLCSPSQQRNEIQSGTETV